MVCLVFVAQSFVACLFIFNTFLDATAMPQYLSTTGTFCSHIEDISMLNSSGSWGSHCLLTGTGEGSVCRTGASPKAWGKCHQGAISCIQVSEVLGSACLFQQSCTHSITSSRTLGVSDRFSTTPIAHSPSLLGGLWLSVVQWRSCPCSA